MLFRSRPGAAAPGATSGERPGSGGEQAPRARRADAVREPAAPATAIIPPSPGRSALCRARRAGRPGWLATHDATAFVAVPPSHPRRGGRQCQGRCSIHARLHAGPCATSLAALCYPLSTSRKHVPVTVGRRCICDLATKLLSAAGASASRRARRGRVSAADAGVPRAAQPERAGRGIHLGHERRLRARIPAGQQGGDVVARRDRTEVAAHRWAGPAGGSGRWARSRSWRPVPATACVTPQRGERRRQRRGDLARPMAGCRASPPAASHRGCGAIPPGRRAGAARWSRGQPV